MNLNLDETTGLPSSYDFLNNINPLIIIVLLIIIVIYYFMFISLGSSNYSEESNKSLKVLEIVLWGLFIGILFLNGVKYFLNVDISAGIKNVFTNEPEIDINIDSLNKKASHSEPTLLSEIEDDIASIPNVLEGKEVFHIQDNKYTYKDAKEICSAYDASLATYDQLENAYNAGGEWCGYGWSAGQMALYPTQKETYNKLQKKKGHEHDCGRPGINGGYIANENVRFGVNCFGYKPKMKDNDMILSTPDILNNETSNRTRQEKIVGFNSNKWNRI